MLRKENLKKETESLLITAQNNAIRTNYVKAKIDNMQQNNKCRLCDESDETIKSYKRMQQPNTKRVQDETRQDGEGNQLGIVQEVSIGPY